MQSKDSVCFAVKPNIDELLDATRSVYSQIIEEIHALSENYRIQCKSNSKNS